MIDDVLSSNRLPDDVKQAVQHSTGSRICGSAFPAASTDFVTYDVLKGKVVHSPSDFEGLIQRLTEISRGRKIAIQNGGWSTSKTDTSSEEEQVEFIREFYRVLYRQSPRGPRAQKRRSVYGPLVLVVILGWREEG